MQSSSRTTFEEGSSCGVAVHSVPLVLANLPRLIGHVLFTSVFKISIGGAELRRARFASIREWMPADAKDVKKGTCVWPRSEERNARLEKRIAALEKQQNASSESAKLAEPYSMKAEEKRQQARGKKKRPRQRQQTPWSPGHGRKIETGSANRRRLSRRRSPERLPTVAHSGGVAPGKQPGRLGCLPCLPRPEKPIWPNPGRAGPL